MFAQYSYAVSALAYFVLFVLSLFWIKKSPLALPASITVFFSLVWSCDIVYVLHFNELYRQATLATESLRNLAWFLFLSVLISRQQFNQLYFLLRYSWQSWVILLVGLVIVILESFTELRYQLQQLINIDFRLVVHIGFAIMGLMLVEQLYRNALQEQRWAIKFTCLSVAAIFVYDFVLYSKSLLFNSLDLSLWNARGVVNALTTPLLIISFNRLNLKQTKVQFSNQVIFHTTVLLGAGIYLLLMSLAGYYIKLYGGTWGSILQISFIFLAVLLLSVFFISGKIRALAKVYLGKNFLRHRYDYREEWLKLSDAIAKFKSADELSDFIVTTLSSLTDSSGGGLWTKNDQQDFNLIIEKSLGEHHKQLVLKTEPLVDFLVTKQWLIDYIEYFEDPDIYAGAGLDKWYVELKEIWLIIPLFQQNNLIAFVILTQPKVSRRLDWEDHDLLKTVGMQLANALALSQTSESLSLARQFEAYNRFSAFLVHDLKNLVAQISLIVKNAEKHKRNPEFIDDSIETLENVVTKIEYLLSQLKKGNHNLNHSVKLNLVDVIKDVIQQQQANQPDVTLTTDAANYRVMGEHEKMVAIFGHLVQNAQEATDNDGTVNIIISDQKPLVRVEIIDTGYGMDEDFIQQRLFKPFDTTKGNAGMGIGVYEAREYILKQSGKIEVESVVGEGTRFIIDLPCVTEDDAQ